ncbi:hypothetical protein TrVE_jg7293 [Triparma verrucosa]|uniref:Uncharacterized protein n=2 Tax=Triparma TaxID=722752 RepID=A0A9W7AGU8_9STRA|nr:hypothetical protein TrST_g2548 [Triparma strigata]GMI00897.1 hypothetical protein TrVE_jg7293 [Triparma verrucosa]
MSAPPPSPTGSQQDKILDQILKLTNDQRKKLLSKVKTKIQKKSLSSSRAAAAAVDFRLSRWWRFYCFWAACAGVAGQLCSLLGLFNKPDPTRSPYDPHRLWYDPWFASDPHFVYQQITFVTSTLYIYNYYSLTTNRPSGSIPRILMVYPIVTIAYFTVFTGGQILGLTVTEYMNHVLNQVLHVYAVLYCDSIRRYILKSGLGLILKDATFFCIAYYCWIWQCYFSLGKWPYDFLDLRESLGNKIFFAVAAGCYLVVVVNFKVCVWVEEKVVEAKEKKSLKEKNSQDSPPKRAKSRSRSKSRK